MREIALLLISEGSQTNLLLGDDLLRVVLSGGLRMRAAGQSGARWCLTSQPGPLPVVALAGSVQRVAM